MKKKKRGLTDIVCISVLIFYGVFTAVSLGVMFYLQDLSALPTFGVGVGALATAFASFNIRKNEKENLIKIKTGFSTNPDELISNVTQTINNEDQVGG